MLCESCHTNQATVHLTESAQPEGKGSSPKKKRAHHFCQQCADRYFACTPGMNGSRNLICLSDFYRSGLYDKLEIAHPEAFDTSDTAPCERSSELMATFLREQLTKDKIELNEDGFNMLCADFFGSHHFYTRIAKFNKKKQ